jgi:hypothetical protein
LEIPETVAAWFMKLSEWFIFLDWHKS